MRDDKRYQTMVFAIRQYNWHKTEEEARNLMWKDIGNFLKLLTKNNYIAVVYDDDTDIIVIQYEHNEKNDPWGAANPEWITEDELWTIQSSEEDDSSNEEE